MALLCISSLALPCPGGCGVLHLQPPKLLHTECLAMAGVDGGSRLLPLPCPNVRHCPNALPADRVGSCPSYLEPVGSCEGSFLGMLPQGEQGWCEGLRKPGPAQEWPLEQGGQAPAWPSGQLTLSPCSSQRWALSTRLKCRNTRPRKASPCHQWPLEALLSFSLPPGPHAVCRGSVSSAIPFQSLL